MRNASPDIDVVLGGRYRLMSRIAGGGMGDVWCASDESLGRVVAVKILRREYADDPTFLQRFRAEARHAAVLSHPGIATVYDYSDGSRDEVGQPFLVMEHVPGEPLSQTLFRDGALSEDRTLDVLGQAALALQAAHDEGVIHRDIKPGNLLLTPDGRVKLSDFGISRARNSVPLTQTGAIMGTAFYISPEQASGQSVTPASDLYSLGVVAYECLSGRKPFLGDTPVSVALAQVRDDVPPLPSTVHPRVRQLVLRLLAKAPDDRPATAGDLGREALALRNSLDLPGGSVAEAAPATGIADAAAPPAVGDRWARTGPDTDPGFELPALREPRRWVPYAVGFVALAVVITLTVYACSGPADTTERAGLRGSAPPVGTVTDVMSSADSRPADPATHSVAVRAPAAGQAPSPLASRGAPGPGQARKKDGR